MQIHSSQQRRYRLRTNHRPGNRKPNAFTLIEITLVVLILGILSATVGIRLNAALTEHRLNSAIEQFQSIEHLVRERSTQKGTSWLLIDVDDSTLTIGTGSQSYVRIHSAVRCVYLNNQKVDSGHARIQFLPDGSSESYCLEFAEGDFRKWLLIVGGTGQACLVEKHLVENTIAQL